MSQHHEFQIVNVLFFTRHDFSLRITSDSCSPLSFDVLAEQLSAKAIRSGKKLRFSTPPGVFGEKWLMTRSAMTLMNGYMMTLGSFTQAT